MTPTLPPAHACVLLLCVALMVSCVVYTFWPLGGKTSHDQLVNVRYFFIVGASPAALGVEVAAPDGEPVWRSDDCERDAPQRILDLDAGQEDTSIVVWPSATGGRDCDLTDTPAVVGDHEVTAHVGGVRSDPVTVAVVD